MSDKGNTTGTSSTGLSDYFSAVSADASLKPYFTLGTPSEGDPQQALEKVVADALNNTPDQQDITIQYDDFSGGLGLKNLVAEQFNRLSDIPYIEGAHIDAKNERFVLDLSLSRDEESRGSGLGALFKDNVVSASVFVGLDEMKLENQSFAQMDERGVAAGFTLKVGV